MRINPASTHPTNTLTPISITDRVPAVDVMRGAAVLGILVMNIISFGLPSAAYMNPMGEGLEPYQGAFAGLNKAAWWLAYVLFDTKMMTIFSMLFGAGVVMMGSRVDQDAASGKRAGFARVYYRRLFWLFLIGMAHAWLIWYGDILVAYALCGVVLYPLRRLRPSRLIWLGVIVASIAVPFSLLSGAYFLDLRNQADQSRAKLEAGEPLSQAEQKAIEVWRLTLSGFGGPGPEIDDQVASYRGSLSQVVKARAAETLFMQTAFFLTWTMWRSTGMMLIGMGLMKLRVFTAERPTRFYAKLAVIGYAVGLPVVWWGGTQAIKHQFSPPEYLGLDSQYNYLASVPIALGHVGVIMLVVKLGACRWVTRRLSAVGRMAFTNYLMQSLICTFIFYGWGLGMFGRMERAQLYLVVGGVWALQLTLSLWWLERFRMGPAEWAWRSLTYLKLQSWKIRVATQDGIS